MNFDKIHRFVKRPVFRTVLLALIPIRLNAQHHESARQESHTPDGLMASEGSGTAWLPANTPMNAIDGKWNDWDLMFHSQIFLQYIEAPGKRGDQQTGSINWFMGMMEREAAGGKVGLRTMLSLEPWTIGKCGFPDLLQTGEECHGERIHDRQHPHDLLMELAAYWDMPVSKDLGLKVYAGPVAEPALGPTAFPHRPSAFPGPLAPISHHWFDASHISFGVVTLGLHGRHSMIEASAFNGREPDENRTDLDVETMDSYSGRLTWMPMESTVFQISGAYLHEGEAAEEGETGEHDLKRYTTSVTVHDKIGESMLFSTVAYGLNQHEESDSSAGLVETSLTTVNHNTWGLRAEWVQKSTHDLVLEDPTLADRKFDTGKLSLSVLHEFAAEHAWLPGIGGSVDISTYPKDLTDSYGDRPQVGYVIFASLRPKAMDPEKHHAM